MKPKKYHTLRVFYDTARIAPARFISQYLFASVDGVLFGYSAIQLQVVFDGVIGVSANSVKVSEVVAAILVFLAMKAGSEIASVISNYLGNQYYQISTEYFLEQINRKLSKVPPLAFESSESLDAFQRAHEGALVARGLLNIIMDIVTFYAPYFFIISNYLFKQKPDLVLIMVLFFLPVFLTNRLKRTRHQELEKALASSEREKSTYFDYLAKYEYLRETRTLRATSFFKDLYDKARSSHNQQLVMVREKDLKTDSISKLTVTLGYMLSLALLIGSTVRGQISVGTFAALFAALDGLFLFTEELFVRRLGSYAENFPKLKNLIWLLNLEETHEDEDGPFGFTGIHLKNVCFRYPDSEVDSLNGINLTISQGETIALVGSNGSGKTTLAKIILGLYRPSGGEVFFENVNGARTKQELFRGNATAVFQNFNKYKVSLDDNVRISEIKKHYTEGEIRGLLDAVGFDLEARGLADGLQTICSKEFGGTDFSGGEWQKIAISRAIFRKRDFVVLDEPTAAIDPIQEHKLYALFADLSKNKTAIIVTHRLASISFCSRIIVMSEGRIVGDGTHEDLLRRSSAYRELWNAGSGHSLLA